MYKKKIKVENYYNMITFSHISIRKTVRQTKIISLKEKNIFKK